jgi:hypothetical protein
MESLRENIEIKVKDFSGKREITSIKIIQTKETTFIVRCCIYLTTYDWIKSFLKITIEGRAIYGNLENKINTLYRPVENSIHKNNDADDR